MKLATASSVTANLPSGLRTNPAVFVVSSDPSVCNSLQRLIPYTGSTVEIFATAHGFLNRRRSGAPSCLILDLNLPDIHGLDLQKRVANDSAIMPIIFMTTRADISSAVQAMKAGAVEFFTAPLIDNALLSAINEALSRSRAGLAAQAEIQVLRYRYGTLSVREREIMDLVVRGPSNKLIAFNLGITEFTVKTHRGRVMRKMKANSLPGLVNMAARLSRHDRPDAPSTYNRSPIIDWQRRDCEGAIVEGALQLA
jgi:FixJ family two-component response regulator